MELWVYEEETNNPLGIVDRFADLRVARRYDEPGEIEIEVPVAASLLLRPGMLLWPTTGKEVFVIETTRIEEREDGDMMAVSARTASALLGRRALHLAKYYEGTGGSIIKQMMDSVFTDKRRTFEHFSYQIDASLGNKIGYETTPMLLLEGIQNVCKASGIGFVCEFDPVSRDMVFRLVNGVDRTASALGVMTAIFDAEHENITKMNYTDSIADVATVAYVMGETEAESDVRKWLEYDPNALTGYARYEAVLESGKTSTTDQKNANGEYVKLTPAQYTNLLRDYGAEKLASRGHVAMAEGELVSDSELIRYGEDYALGDIVFVRNQAWGTSVASRITETEESFQGGIRSVRLTVGDRMPTLLEKMKRL